MITVLPVTGANLTSISNALQRAGARWKFSTDRKAISSCEKLLIPGVGSARTSMQKLASLGLIETVKNLQQPVLGICIGMQLLFKESGEYPGGSCLGIIRGSVLKINPEPGYPVPHMGWNRLIVDKDSCLLRKSDSGKWMYFVHSFAGEDGPWTTASCTYRENLTAAVEYKNFTGLQFHPEKSGEAGLDILKRFVEL